MISLLQHATQRQLRLRPFYGGPQGSTDQCLPVLMLCRFGARIAAMRMMPASAIIVLRSGGLGSKRAEYSGWPSILSQHGTHRHPLRARIQDAAEENNRRVRSCAQVPDGLCQGSCLLALQSGTTTAY